jgi:hypothetical protein
MVGVSPDATALIPPWALAGGEFWVFLVDSGAFFALENRNARPSDLYN